MAQQRCMFSHSGGSWEERPLEEALAEVEAGRAREYVFGELMDYGDGMRSFKCLPPCEECGETARAA